MQDDRLSVRRREQSAKRPILIVTGAGPNDRLPKRSGAEPIRRPPDRSLERQTFAHFSCLGLKCQAYLAVFLLRDDRIVQSGKKGNVLIIFQFPECQREKKRSCSGLVFGSAIRNTVLGVFQKAADFFRFSFLVFSATRKAENECELHLLECGGLSQSLPAGASVLAAADGVTGLPGLEIFGAALGW